MKSRTTFISLIMTLAALAANAQGCGDAVATQKTKPSTIGIVISSNDPETVWNAFRLANYSLKEGDTVSIFLLGKGVESPNISTSDYDVKEMMEDFSGAGGKILACGTCLKTRKTEGSKLCPVSTLADLYAIIKTNQIVLTF